VTKQDVEEILKNNKDWMKRLHGMVANFVKENKEGEGFLVVMHNNMSEDDQQELENTFGSVVFIKSGGMSA
jgi:hypothetical protein